MGIAFRNSEMRSGFESRLFIAYLWGGEGVVVKGTRTFIPGSSNGQGVKSVNDGARKIYKMHSTQSSEMRIGLQKLGRLGCLEAL